MSLNSKVDTMSAELTAIKMECKALREEFSGVAPPTPDADDKNLALAERTSMKQIFEEMLYELKAMRQQRTENVSKIKPAEAPRVNKMQTKPVDTVTVLKDDVQAYANSQPPFASKFPVVDIAFPDGEEKGLLQEMARLKKLNRIPVDGDTMKGKSIQEILDGGPIPPVSRNSGFGNTQRTLKLGILLSNYSRIQLLNPQYHIESGSIQGPKVLVVHGQTTEATVYNTGKHEDQRIAGVLSFDIGSTTSRLTVQFDVDYSKRSFYGHKYYLGLGFTPENLPIDSKLSETREKSLQTAEFCTTDSYSENRQGRERYPSPLVIRNDNRVAVAAFSDLEGDGYSIIVRVDLMERIQKHAIVKRFNCATGTKTIEDGNSLLDIPQMGNMESCIVDRRGCVIEFANCLNVTLQNFSHFISHARQYVLPPPQISPFTREMFYASDESYTEGLFAYDIGGTNLQLRVFFRVKQGMNCFALAFEKEGSATSAASLNSYMVSEPWKTRPYIFAMGADGEQVLEFRNLRLTAVMTTGDKSVLKVVVSAF